MLLTQPSSPTPQGAAKPRSLTPVILILLMTLAPIVLALLAYYVPALGLRPAETTNYGTLIQPQRPLPDAQAMPLTQLDGQPFDLSSLQGKWLLVSADTGACPESCVRKLFTLRNSHASQGKHVDRLARVWFITDDQAVPPEVLEAYKGTHMVRVQPEQLARFLAPQATPEQLNAALRGPMWIIDPLGHLMMRFPENADPLEVRDDIIKLIKNSRIG
jgi:hypothetical protein